MSNFEHLRTEVTGQIGRVTLARPPVNAVTQPMYVEIRELFNDVERYLPGASVAILAGEGRHFCGGNDLNEFLTLTPENSGERMLLVRETFFAIRDSAIPVIAAVNGVAVGTGLALAASCDLIVAAQGARFSLPEVGVGVMGGAKHLSRLAPEGVVRRMHLTADMVPVEDLLPYGGIAKVVPEDELLDAATALAAQIARHSPVAVKFAKRSLNTIEYMDIKSGYEFEQSLSGELSAYDDSKEAVRAFFERREPQYTGK